MSHVLEAMLAQRAATKDGLHTRDDARAAGLTDAQILYRVATGLWREVLPRVYASSSTPETPEMRRRAALLWAGDNAVLSHRSAAALWRLDGEYDSAAEIIVPRKQRLRSTVVHVHRADLDRADRTLRDGMRCTTLPRTIVDLASVLASERLEVAFESARRQYRLTVSAVESQLERMRSQGRGGAAQLRHLFDALENRPPAEYPMEVKVARLLRETSLPEPARQYEVRILGSTFRLDFAWPDALVALECDGRRFHDFQRDRTRWRIISSSGWRIIPVTWRDVTTQWSEVVGTLTAAMNVGPNLR